MIGCFENDIRCHPHKNESLYESIKSTNRVLGNVMIDQSMTDVLPISLSSHFRNLSFHPRYQFFPASKSL